MHGRIYKVHISKCRILEFQYFIPVVSFSNTLGRPGISKHRVLPSLSNCLPLWKCSVLSKFFYLGTEFTFHCGREFVNYYCFRLSILPCLKNQFYNIIIGPSQYNNIVIY